MKIKRSRSRVARVLPHQIEAWIRASAAAARALALLGRALEAQQTTSHSRQRRQIRAAKKLLRTSIDWLRTGERKIKDEQ